jgi:hypothetical protein
MDKEGEEERWGDEEKRKNMQIFWKFFGRSILM